MILASLIPLLCLLLAVVLCLLLKLQKTSSTTRKQENSLWVESSPLKAITETAAGEE